MKQERWTKILGVVFGVALIAASMLEQQAPQKTAPATERRGRSERCVQTRSRTGGSRRRSTIRSGRGARCPASRRIRPTGSSSPCGATGIDRIRNVRTAPTISWSSTATAKSSSGGSSGTRS